MAKSTARLRRLAETEGQSGRCAVCCRRGNRLLLCGGCGRELHDSCARLTVAGGVRCYRCPDHRCPVCVTAGPRECSWCALSLEMGGAA